QLRQLVFDLLASPLAVNKVVNHPTLDWPRAVERVERGQVVNGVGLVTPQHVGHAAGFKLEDARGQAGLKNAFIGLRIVERDLFQVNRGTALSNKLQGV